MAWVSSMAEMSRRFNFDDFDEQVAEALEENARVMAEAKPIRRPGEIGSVIMTPLYREWFGDELPPADLL